MNSQRNNSKDYRYYWGFLADASGKEPTFTLSSIPRSGRSPGGGHGNPLKYCCLENPMDKGDWLATVHGVTKSQSGTTEVTSHSQIL